MFMFLDVCFYSFEKKQVFLCLQTLCICQTNVTALDNVLLLIVKKENLSVV